MSDVVVGGGGGGGLQLIAQTSPQPARQAGRQGRERGSILMAAVLAT